MVEHMPEEHGVGGSIPPSSTWESTLVGEHDGVRDGSIPSFGNGGSNPPFPSNGMYLSWLESTTDNREVVGSSPTIPIPVRENLERWPSG